MDPRTADDLPIDLQGTARRLTADLGARFGGVFGPETIEHLVVSCFVEMTMDLDGTRSLWGQVEERAEAHLTLLAEAVAPTRDRPSILFLCTHNAGRSQIAAAWARSMGGERVRVVSAGSAPAAAVHDAVVRAMDEVGIAVGDDSPTAWSTAIVEDADVVVTMGCGDACPLVEGTKYLDWDLDDPANRPIEQVREIRDQIRDLVADLLIGLGVLDGPDRDVETDH